MLRKNLILALLAALVVAPAAVQASELSRRLTIRYPGQDAKHHHRHDWRHESDRHDWRRPHDHREWR